MTYPERPPGTERIASLNAFKRHTNKRSRQFKALPNILALQYIRQTPPSRSVGANASTHKALRN